MGAFTCLDLDVRDANYFFLAVGWALLAISYLLFFWSEAVIDWLIVKGHEHRRAAEVHEREAARKPRNSKWAGHGLLGRVLALRDQEEDRPPRAADPASFLTLVKKAATQKANDDGRSEGEMWPSLALIRVEELRKATDAKRAPTIAQKVHEQLETLRDEMPCAESHLRPGWRLRSMPVLLQTLVLLQCMYQARG